jgi:hypothetical protein
VKEAWDMAVPRRGYAAAEIALLGLIPADSAARVLSSWISGRDMAAFAAIVGMFIARDTSSLLATHAKLEKAAAALPPNAQTQTRDGIKYMMSVTHAYYTLARGDSATALKEFDALPLDDFNIPTDQFIRGRLIARTDPKRAFELLTSFRSTGDILSVARELEIGRLAERVSNTARAVDAYSYVASSWQNTDNEQLKAAVKESRDALKRLDSDGRLRAQLATPR